MLAPVCLFTYNRLSETQQTVKALEKNYLAQYTELIIFSDGPKNKIDAWKIINVREFLQTITGFKKVTIYESPINRGLANSIISGVTKIIKQYEKVIILEDDLITTPNFLDFMNQALDFYEKHNFVKSVNGYSLDLRKYALNTQKDVYFQMRPFPWGWGTWASEWNQELFYDKIFIKQLIKDKKNIKLSLGYDIIRMAKRYLAEENMSWYVRFVLQHYAQKKMSVFPFSSKVENIGFTKQGTHCKSINSYKHFLDRKYSRTFKFSDQPVLDSNLSRKYLKYFTWNYKLKYRLSLLKEVNGRKLIFNEIKNKTVKWVKYRISELEEAY